ncbi:mitochondrial inner membrane anchored oxidoreductase Aif1 [Schizosaccharomyces osmophilus]|uniref:Mitochondrial inner membrane anchored oxidoreductase Aif1 n=1 Tax=Schizosaccharomyces osmophilus TaxID=2545709 RepID=A0AAE9WDD5_9SCHI|nr:mitochondrial inner membrane anchored oxidoreductase Aif1 [Schizosaccharomyces osmophilus]WBW74189.1 mitochondrial inner membrane anchored oxidoreductase Aif1 [Schizosaccharomyces osmophilus]
MQGLLKFTKFQPLYSSGYSKARSLVQPLQLLIQRRKFSMSNLVGKQGKGVQGRQYELDFDRTTVAKNGTKTEAKVLGTAFNVLLVRAKNQYFATAGKCSHYGAPLVNGAVTSNGRIVCPWHGACFDSATGDVEDSPAIAGLRTFPISSAEDGRLFIEVEDQGDGGSKFLQPAGCWRNKAAEVYEKGSVQTQAAAPHVCIVGGGKGASVAAEYLRERNYKGRITVLTREDVTPYDRPKLSKTLLHDHSKIALRSKEYYDDLDIEFRFKSNVNKIDPKAKTVHFGENESLDYSKLILATGGEANKFPLPGLDASNVYCLRSLADATKLASATNESGKKKDIAIIGSSFIGLELAVALKDHNVSVVGMESAPFEKIMGKEMGNAIKALHEQNNIHFFLENSIKEAQKSSADPSIVDKVVLKDGEIIPAEVVVLAVGVKPNLSYIADHVQLEKDGGVKVDKNCRVEGLDDVYAVGDIAHAPYAGLPENGNTRIEHWDVAGNTGRVAANHILLGENAEYTTKSFTPFFWSAQGKQIRYCGNNAAEGFDDIVVQGSVPDYKFAMFYTKGEKVVGVSSIMKDPTVSQCSRLFLTGSMPTKSQLKEGFDVCSIGL